MNSAGLSATLSWTCGVRLLVVVDAGIDASDLVLIVYAPFVVGRVVVQIAMLLSGVRVVPNPTFLVANLLALRVVDGALNPSLRSVVLTLITAMLERSVVDLAILRVETTGMRIDADDFVRRNVNRILSMRWRNEGWWNRTWRRLYRVSGDGWLWGRINRIRGSWRVWANRIRRDGRVSVNRIRDGQVSVNRICPDGWVSVNWACDR